jgi:CBS domain-containing protein
MTEGPYSVPVDAPLAEVCTAMADEKYGAALVVDRKGHLLGIFTTTDALRALAQLAS